MLAQAWNLFQLFFISFFILWLILSNWTEIKPKKNKLTVSDSLISDLLRAASNLNPGFFRYQCKNAVYQDILSFFILWLILSNWTEIKPKKNKLTVSDSLISDLLRAASNLNPGFFRYQCKNAVYQDILKLRLAWLIKRLFCRLF